MKGRKKEDLYIVETKSNKLIRNSFCFKSWIACQEMTPLTVGSVSVSAFKS